MLPVFVIIHLVNLIEFGVNKIFVWGEISYL